MAVQASTVDVHNILAMKLPETAQITFQQAFKLKDYTGSRPDGLMLMPIGVVLREEERINGLLENVSRRHVALIHAVRQNGKTATLQLAFWRAIELKNAGYIYDRVVYFNAAECKADMSWEDFVYAKLGETWKDLTGPQPHNRKVLILVDNFDELCKTHRQDMGAIDTLWKGIESLQDIPVDSSMALDNRHVNIIATSLPTFGSRSE